MTLLFGSQSQLSAEDLAQELTADEFFEGLSYGPLQQFVKPVGVDHLAESAYIRVPDVTLAGGNTDSNELPTKRLSATAPTWYGLVEQPRTLREWLSWWRATLHAHLVHEILEWTTWRGQQAWTPHGPYNAAMFPKVFQMELELERDQDPFLKGDW